MVLISHRRFHLVMAGHSRPKDGVASARLCPAIHDLSCGTKNVDARDKPGHDEFVGSMPMKTIRICDCPEGNIGRRETPA
jgi:hypothetical protein